MRVRQFRNTSLFLVARIVLAGPYLKAFLFFCRFLLDSPFIPVMTCRFNRYVFCCGHSCTFGIAEDCSALAAGPVFNVSGIRTGRFFCLDMRDRMASRINYCICFVDLIICIRVTVQFSTSDAGPVLIVSCVRTGRFLCVNLR